MSEIEARFRVSLQGKDELANFFRQSLGEVKQFEAEHGRAMANVNKSLQQTGQEFVRFGATAARTLQSISGLNFGIAGQARSVLEFRDSINRLATAASLAEGQIGGLKDQVLDISVATGQMKESVTDALGAFVAKTGDIETARKNLELYARTATATGASLKDVAEIGAQLSQKMGIKNQSAAMGILAKQGDIGAIELKDLAVQGPRLFAAAAAAGYSGEGGVRSAGALAQLFAEGVGGTGSAARVATSVENVFQSINQKQGAIEKLGIKVGDRDPISIAEDIVMHFKGNVRAISAAKLFTSAGMRGIQTMALGYNDEKGVHHAGYNESGKFEELERYKNVGSTGIIDEKFRRNSSSGLSFLNRTQAAIDRSTDRNLGDTTESLARQSGLVARAYDWATAHPGLALGGGAAALFGRSMINNWANGGSGGGGGIGGLLGGGSNRVYVTNWPSGGGGLGALGDAANGAAKDIGVFKLAAQNAGAVLGALAGGVALGTYLDDKYKVSDTLADSATALTSPDALQNDLKGVGTKGGVYASIKALLRGGGAQELGEELVDVSHQIGAKYQHGNAKPPAEYNAELVESIRAIRPQYYINIHGDTASVDGDGTRKPDVMVRRGGAR